MAMRNNTELKALIATRLKRSDKTTEIIDWIRLTEKRIVRVFAKNGLQDKLVRTKTLTAAATVSLPAGCRSVEALYLDTNPKRSLGYMPPASFFSKYISSETGKPKGYTLQGNVIHLGPAPDDTYSTVCWFRQDLDITRVLDQLLIPEQDETDYDNSAPNGTFAAGASHAAGDIITLASGQAQVLVDAVSGGAVTEFTVIEIDHSDLVDSAEVLSQSATDGSGTGFTLTLGANNISNLVLLDHPELYLYGTLAEGFADVRNQTEAQRYNGLFAEAVVTLEDEAFNVGGAMQIYTSQASAGAPKLRR